MSENANNNKVYKNANRFIKPVAFLAALIFAAAPGISQLRLDRIFTDNMVLQREKPIMIWGKSSPESLVVVSLAGKTNSTSAAPDSTWKISFQPMKATTIPQTLMVISTSDTIHVQNILIGDVWLCIGQSNMEWPMQKEMHFSNEIKTTLPADVRFLNPMYAGKNIFASRFTDSVSKQLTREHFYNPWTWQVCDVKALPLMSAVAYYFGKEINSLMGIPVGLINLSIGGPT